MWGQAAYSDPRHSSSTSPKHLQELRQWHEKDIMHSLKLIFRVHNSMGKFSQYYSYMRKKKTDISFLKTSTFKFP